MDVSPAKRSYFTCANVWWKLLFHSTLVEPLCVSKQDIVSPDCDRIVRHFFHQIAPLTRKIGYCMTFFY